MRLIDDVAKERNVAAVVPTMNVNLDRVRKLALELDSNGVDLLLVEDSGPLFSFSRSMNAGITALLTKPHVKYIVLSNDDVCNIQGFDNMLGALKEGKGDYAQPYANGIRPSMISTRSQLRLMLNFGLKKHAPFYALRIAGVARTYTNSQRPLFLAPSLSRRKEIISVQPFGLFSRKVLEHEMFDENFHNGMEDHDLAYRLHLHGYSGLTDADWNVFHAKGESFKSLYARSRTGSYYGGETQFAENLRYFIKKHSR